VKNSVSQVHFVGDYFLPVVQAQNRIIWLNLDFGKIDQLTVPKSGQEMSRSNET
jgi:hypothetical protein